MLTLRGSSQLTDSTDNPNERSRARLVAQVVASTVILALAWGWLAASAHADGDPASDVLATQSLFLPQDAGIAVAQRTQLSGLLQGAAQSGYPIRVAIVASSADLGSVTELWREPQTYARFLGQELSLVYRGPLLVVMPNGFGLYAPGPEPTDPSALAGLRSPTGGGELGTAALTAVERLATAAGHAVPIPAAIVTRSNGGGSDVIPLIALAIGVTLIAAAWTASLRARPARLGRRKAPTT